MFMPGMSSRNLLDESCDKSRNTGPTAQWMVHSTVNRYLYYSLCIFTAGTCHVLCTMYPDWKRRIISRECSPTLADSVLISEENGDQAVVDVKHNFVDGNDLISFEVNCKRYWTSAMDAWVLRPLPEVPNDFSNYIIRAKMRVGKLSRALLMAVYGTNTMELPKASFLDILLKTMVQPFYLFQYFAVILWMFENYILYSCVIIAITGGAIYLTTSESVFNLKRLHDLAGAAHMVRLVDPLSGKVSDSEISDRELVPGDWFVVNQGQPLPCDAVLLSGRVSVDESCLTGESVPVNKVPVEEAVFDEKKAEETDVQVISRLQGSTLFGGTKTLLCTPPTLKRDCTHTSIYSSDDNTIPVSVANDPPPGVCVAVAYKTGFRSAKGQLIATLLNPKDDFLSFFSDAMWVILFMAVLCTGLYMWCGAYLRENGTSWRMVFMKYLDAITIAVPPGLTASLTVATGISIERLRKKNIFVSESTRVNWAGIIGAACFDKTGTLTEERLHFKGITVPRSRENATLVSEELTPESPNIPPECMELMGTCHALAMLDGTASGDPLEVELFRASGYILQQPTSTDHIGDSENGQGLMDAYCNGICSRENKFEILRHFEFSSDRLRAGSLVRKPNKDIMYYCKGSPEAIFGLVRPDSVPPDINATLTGLSKRGFRVLALCYKLVRDHTDSQPSIKALLGTPQQEFERDSIFLGLVFLSNALKAETVSTIRALRAADIKCNMITGDHIYTAIAIATDCGLLQDGDDVNIVDSDETGDNVHVISTHTGTLVNSSLLMFLSEYDIMKPVQIAVTGRALVVVKEKYGYLVTSILERTQVFARMKPSDKQYIVEELQRMTEAQAHVGQEAINPDTEAENDVEAQEAKSPHFQVSACPPAIISTHRERESFTRAIAEKATALVDMHGDGRGQLRVLFCGDGANDMAALRSATVGVSLCEAETSVAAPITSRLQTPGSVVDVIIEGRCSLVTAYVLVSFNIMYGTVQLFNTVMMYNYGLKLGDNTYLIQDLFFTLILGLAISITPPADILDKELPPQRYFTKFIMFKLFAQLICFPIFQLIALRTLAKEEWYNKYDVDDDPLSDTYAYETSVIASMGLAQLMISSVAATIDEPFRQPWYKNKYHTASLVCQAAFLAYQIFGRTSYFMRHILECRPLPYGFCWKLVLIIALNVAVSGLLSRSADYLKKHFS